jgi:hypothetical protein
MVAANDVMEEKRREASRATRPGKTPKRPEDNSVAEVDLHLHELVEDETRLSQGEKLKYQLAYFERSLGSRDPRWQTQVDRDPRCGEGVLREEVRKDVTVLRERAVPRCQHVALWIGSHGGGDPSSN